MRRLLEFNVILVMFPFFKNGRQWKIAAVCLCKNGGLSEGIVYQCATTYIGAPWGPVGMVIFPWLHSVHTVYTDCTQTAVRAASAVFLATALTVVYSLCEETVQRRQRRRKEEKKKTKSEN